MTPEVILETVLNQIPYSYTIYKNEHVIEIHVPNKFVWLCLSTAPKWKVDLYKAQIASGRNSYILNLSDPESIPKLLSWISQYDKRNH